MHFIMTDSESGTSIRFLKIVNIQVPNLKKYSKTLGASELRITYNSILFQHL